jgi:hypothetical protein
MPADHFGANQSSPEYENTAGILHETDDGSAIIAEGQYAA